MAGAAWGWWHCAGEAGLNDAPPGRKIAVAFGQGPDAVQVVGEDHPGVDLEGAFVASISDSLAEGFDMADQGVGTARGEGHGEEYGCAGDAGAEISGHDPTLAKIG